GRGVGICFTELFAAPDARRGRVLVRRTGNPWRESAEVRPILCSNVFSGRAVRRVLSAWLPAIHAHPGDGLLGGGSFHVRAFWRDPPGQRRRELDWHPRCRQHRILLLPDGAPHRESLVRGGLPHVMGLGGNLFLRRARQRPDVSWPLAANLLPRAAAANRRNGRPGRKPSAVRRARRYLDRI